MVTVACLRSEAGETTCDVPVVNPTPHEVVMLPEEGTVDISAGVRLMDKSGLFREAAGFLPAGDKKAVGLTVDFGEKKAVRAGVRAVSGAYLLAIGSKEISVLGYDERGAFYGLQTLRQIVAQAESGLLPCVRVNDWPDLPSRGVVEGFYGTPWSHQARLSLIDFYGRYKMNTYIYGPKDDPYHSSPDWRKPYPEDEAADIKELVEACRANYVDFVWAIHPGQDIKWNEEDYAALVAKFENMYALGVRAFAIFFDDISGDGANPYRQVELLNRLGEEFVKVKGDVAPLIICPTDYNRSWANPTERGSLAVYGRELDPSVRVFWTGDYVCSDLTPATLEWVGSRIQRPALYWWNFPVTDYCRHIVMQGPVYGLDQTLTAENLCGFVSNPMEHAEASKLALYGVADYTWNIEDYDPHANWERGLGVLAGEDAWEAYRTFAIHSCDTESGYRRDESWETEVFDFDDYTQQQYDALLEEFRRVEAAPEEMAENCSNEALMRELSPWLEEFGKLGVRGVRTLELIKVFESGDAAAFWSAYTANLMSPEEKAAYEAHKSGSMKLNPFCERAMDGMAAEFYRRVAGRSPYSYTAIGSFANSGTVSGKLMFDDDSTTFYTSAYAQQTDDWIGVDLGLVRDLREIEILQGRNSVDDVDYFDRTVLEASKDGQIWFPVTADTLERQYIIRWQGRGVDARYVRLRKIESDKTNWAAVRTFSVNPVRPDSLGFDMQAQDRDRAVYAFDNNPYTYYTLDGDLSFGIIREDSTGTDVEKVLLLRPRSEVTVTQYAADGSVAGRLSTEEPYCRLTLSPDAVRVRIEGDTDIFEIL